MRVGDQYHFSWDFGGSQLLTGRKPGLPSSGAPSPGLLQLQGPPPRHVLHVEARALLQLQGVLLQLVRRGGGRKGKTGARSTRSSSREDRKKAPSILVGEPSPKKGSKGTTGGPRVGNEGMNLDIPLKKTPRVVYRVIPILISC